MTFITFHADLETIAGKLVEDGNADDLIIFLDHVADMILRKYGKQLKTPNEQFGVFMSRVREKFGPETKFLIHHLNKHCSGGL